MQTDADVQELARRVYSLRRSGLLKVIVISIAIVAAFAYTLVKLVDAMTIDTIPVYRSAESRSFTNNHRDPDQDDVESADDDVYDELLDEGRKMKHGLDMSMISFNKYNSEAAAIAKEHTKEVMYAEVRRDMSILDADKDEWSPVPLESAKIDTHFSTYNTLTSF